MLTIEYASNPKYASMDGTCIELQVKFVEFAEILPFGATSYDPMPYGVELYNRALAGEFGPVEPYVGSTEDQPTTTGSQTL
jgi:hypothetical protein